eukprot:TRINITY_DN1070_c1_g1_i1.p1 TRINITY_DN1070_c1_g1~~TRINITY_DN1070_c1_g1_i1.p1  ORF type:complete len:797 (-),score=163.26 TRINITY_DN1070_c1_g1_i1:763-3153(-)
MMESVVDRVQPESVHDQVKEWWSKLKETIKEEAKPVIIPEENYRYALVDVYHGIEDTIDTLEETKQELFNRERSWAKRLFSIFKMNETWFFLTILGFACGMLVLACEKVIEWFTNLRSDISSYDELGYMGNYFVWTVTGVFFTLVSTACVRNISPHSAGSGIPAMKSILSGIILHQHLSFRCLLSKIIGIVCCYGGGLAVGKEGPYVHICSIIAYQLAKLPLFNKINKNQGLKIQMLAAGCAAGMAVTFGAPVSGVLFSIETTSTYYLIQNLWKAFMCAVSATLLVKVLGNAGLIAVFSTHFETDKSYQNIEIIIFCFIGIFYGLMGVLFVKFVQKLGQLRKRFKIFQRPYLQSFVVAVITGLVTFPLGENIRSGGPSSVINDLFAEGEMNWQSPSLYFNLSMFILMKFTLAAVTIGLPVVAGLFTPVFICGAASGRLIGEILNSFFPSLGILPAGYAVVGAAAFSAGVTRAIAPGIIVFETTGQLTYVFPVLLTVLISTAVGNFFTASIYDILLQDKKLPYMPIIRKNKAMNKLVATTMQAHLKMLTTDTTYHKLQKTLRTSNFSAYPLVDNKLNRTFLGQIKRHVLEDKLYEHEKQFKLLSRPRGSEPTSSNESTPSRKISELLENSVQKLKLPISFLKSPSTPSSPTTSFLESALQRTKSSDSLIVEEQDNGTSTTNNNKNNDNSDVTNTDDVIIPTDGDADIFPDRDTYFAQPVGLSEFVTQVPNMETVEDMTENAGIEGFDPCPFTVSQSAPLSKVHFLFAILGLSHAWVVQSGKLVGVITKRDLMKIVDK